MQTTCESVRLKGHVKIHIVLCLLRNASQYTEQAILHNRLGSSRSDGRILMLEVGGRCNPAMQVERKVTAGKQQQEARTPGHCPAARTRKRPLVPAPTPASCTGCSLPPGRRTTDRSHLRPVCDGRAVSAAPYSKHVPHS